MVSAKKHHNHEGRIKMTQLLPASIMFFITIGFTSLFFVPVTKFQREDDLVNFYWIGFWSFLALISSVAGAANTLLLLKYNTMAFSDAALMGITASFMFFVMFAWARLIGTLILSNVKKYRIEKRRKNFINPNI